MANIEQQILQLRKEIGKRTREAANLRQKADQQIAGGAVDEGIQTGVRAAATENAIGVLRGKLAQLLPALVDERLRSASPAIDQRASERVAALAKEAKTAADSFLVFFRSWNGLQDNELGKAVATQLLGNFSTAVLSAATDRIYLIAIGRQQAVRQGAIDSAAGRERQAIEQRIRADVAALGVVDAAETQEEKTA